MPELGRPQAAYFFLASPLAGSATGTVLTFTLDQQFGMLHTLGKFRLSVTTDPDVKSKQGGKTVPAPVLAIVQTPADKRTPEQKAQLATYYRSIAPRAVGPTAHRLESLRSAVGPYAEIARLEALLQREQPHARRRAEGVGADRPYRRLVAGGRGGSEVRERHDPDEGAGRLGLRLRQQPADGHVHGRREHATASRSPPSASRPCRTSASPATAPAAGRTATSS